MAPSAKKPANDGKQKSLMSFFGKKPDQQSGGASTSTQKAKPQATDASSKSKPKAKAALDPKTPISKGQNKSSGPPSSVSSRGSMADTPPTSDFVDVDMLEISDDGEERVKSSTKRKSAYGDSDAETHASASSSGHTPVLDPSSPSERIGRVKRRRVSVALLSDDEDEDDADASLNLSRKLSHLKKSPTKKRRSSSRASTDDDDFIVPDDDSEEETKSVKSSSSRASSRMSVLSDDEEDEEEEERPKKSKSKPKAKSKTAVSGSGGGAGGADFSFLTAAERREQEKKSDKKAAELPWGFLEDIRDKDKRRPDDPLYDPRTLHVPASAWKEFTPFEKQFWEIKQNHYDTVLFFQKGKFFELYEDDARIGHQDFDLKLTQRVKMSMVGVPEMSLDYWVAKFLAKGYKVGRVDQAETALGAEMRVQKGKGAATKSSEKEKIVRRELHKVYTNGTLVDGNMLTDDDAGHCISIVERPATSSEKESVYTFGVCILDCATSQFDMSLFEDDVCLTKLETLLRQVRPKELLFTKGKLSVETTRLLKAVLPPACLWTGLREVEGFGYEETLKEVAAMYPASSSEDDEEMESDAPRRGVVLSSNVPAPIRDMADSRGAIEALGIMVWYLRQLNIDKDILSMKNFNIYDPIKRGQGLVLDGQTLAHLEILLNNEGAEDGTLLKLLNRCVTPSGKRLFRIWLCMPLREIDDINARLDAVEDLMDHPTFESDFTAVAKGLPDLERIVSRIHAKNCKVKDFIKVLEAFNKLSKGLNKLTDASESFKSKAILGLLRGAPDLKPNIEHIKEMYVPLEDDRSDLLPVEGKDEEYDTIMDEITGLEKELNAAKNKYEKKLGISLGWWHSAVGNKDIYLIETKAGEKGVPDDWIKNGGTKAKSRWSIPALSKTIRALKEAQENRNTAIKNFRFRVFHEFDEDRATWLRAVRVLAELDCLFSLSKGTLALGEPSCRPEFVEGDEAFVDFEELRHPMLAMSTSVKEFIPNNVHLGGDVGRIALLTGPNMAGKSTVMRMTATGVIMAQLGMHVPAQKARLCPVDSILTRMGAYDNMFSNSSTFKVELDECCKILRDATPKSLVILDELGRGTSTYDGMAIAGAVLHQLSTHTLPLSFFATHYGSLTDDFAYHPNIRNMHMQTMVDEGRRDIVFLYKLIEGAATSSFGTHVANLAGVPIEVVERADLISKQFAEQFKAKLALKQRQSASARLPITAQADFAYLAKLALGAIQQGGDGADEVRKRKALAVLKATAGKYLQARA